MIKNIRGIKYCGTDPCASVTEMGEAFGGFIYGASCNIGFANTPTKITLNIVSENSEYELPKLDVSSGGAMSIQIGGVTSGAGTAGSCSIAGPTTQADCLAAGSCSVAGLATEVDCLAATPPGVWTPGVWTPPVPPTTAGEVTFKRMYIYSYTKNDTPGSKTLTVNFVDHSIMLDKIFVGLIGRHGTRTVQNSSSTYNVANDVQLSPRKLTYGFRLVCAECNEMEPRQLTRPPTWEPPHHVQRLSYMAGNGANCPQPIKTYINVGQDVLSINGGYILLGQEGFKETECEISKITYTFADLCNALDWILGADPMGCGGTVTNRHNLREFDRSATYEANYTGTLREVLSAWAADFSFDFTFDYESDDPRIIGIDLKDSIDLVDIKNAIETGFGPDSEGGLVRSYTENHTLENTYYQTPMVKYIKPARPFQRQKINYLQKVGKVLTPTDTIGKAAHQGRSDDELYVSMGLAKYHQEARLIWLSDLARKRYEEPYWCNKYHKQGVVVPWEFAWDPAKKKKFGGWAGFANNVPGDPFNTLAEFFGGTGLRPNSGLNDSGSGLITLLLSTPADFLKYAGFTWGADQDFPGGCAAKTERCFDEDCLDPARSTDANGFPCNGIVSAFCSDSTKLTQADCVAAGEVWTPVIKPGKVCDSPCKCPSDIAHVVKVNNFNFPADGSIDKEFNPFKHGKCTDPNFHTLFDCLSVPDVGQKLVADRRKPKNKWRPSVNDPRLRRDGIWPSLGFFPVISFNQPINKTCAPGTCFSVPSHHYEFKSKLNTAGTVRTLDVTGGKGPTPEQLKDGTFTEDIDNTAPGLDPLAFEAVLMNRGDEAGVLGLFNPEFLENDGKTIKTIYLNSPVQDGGPAGKFYATLKNIQQVNPAKRGKCDNPKFPTQADCVGANSVWREERSCCLEREVGAPTRTASPPNTNDPAMKGKAVIKNTCYQYNKANQHAAAHLESRFQLAHLQGLCDKQAHPVWCDAEKFSVYLGIWNEAFQGDQGEFDKELADRFLGQYGYWHANRTSPEMVELGFFDEGPANPPPNRRDCPKYHFDMEGGQEHATYLFEHKVTTLPESKIYSGASYPFKSVLRANDGFFAIPSTNDPVTNKRYVDSDPCTFCPERSIFKIEDNAWGTPTENITEIFKNKFIIDIDDAPEFTKDPNVLSDLNLYIPKYKRLDPQKESAEFINIVGLQNFRETIIRPEWGENGFFPAMALIPHLDKMKIDVYQSDSTKADYGKIIRQDPVLEVNYKHWTCTNAQVDGSENADGSGPGTCSNPKYWLKTDCENNGYCFGNLGYATQGACQTAGEQWHKHLWTPFQPFCLQSQYKTKDTCGYCECQTVGCDPGSLPNTEIACGNAGEKWVSNWISSNTAKYDHWCHEDRCTTTTTSAPTTTTASVGFSCWACLDGGLAEVGQVWAMNKNDAEVNCAILHGGYSSTTACTTTPPPTTTTASPGPRIENEQSVLPTGVEKAFGFPPLTDHCPDGVGRANEGSMIFSRLIHQNYARRKQESLIGPPSECVLYCEEDIKSEVCACPEIEEPIHRFSRYDTKYLELRHMDKAAHILYPIEHDYIGFWVSDQSHKGTTMKKQIVMGEPPTPDELEEKNVMGTRIIDVDATPELDALETSQAGRFEEQLVVNNNHVSPPQPEVVSLPQYYSFLLGIEQSADQPGEQIDIRLDGTEFDTLLNPGGAGSYLSPTYGLSSFSISLDGQGISTNLSYRSRPKKLPKRDVLLQKIGPRAIEGKLNAPGRVRPDHRDVQKP